MCLMHPLEYKSRLWKLSFLFKFLIDINSQIHQKYAPDRLFWTLKMQKLPCVGGGCPLPHPPLQFLPHGLHTNKFTKSMHQIAYFEPLKMQKLIDVGGGYPFAHPPPPILSFRIPSPTCDVLNASTWVKGRLWKLPSLTDCVFFLNFG